MPTKIELDKPLVKCSKARDSCASFCPHFGIHKHNDDCERFVCLHMNDYVDCVLVEKVGDGNHAPVERVWEEFPE